MNSDAPTATDRFRKAVDLHQRGLFDHAIEEYQRALEVDPANLDVLVNLGAVYLQKGLADRSIQLLGQVLEVKPEHPLALFNIGKAFLYREDPRTALAAFERAGEIQPGDVEIKQCVGQCLAALGRREEAADLLLGLVKDMAGDAARLSWLGDLLLDLKRPAEALEVFRRAVTAACDSVEPLEGLIRCQLSLGQKEKAMTSLKRALMLEPAHSRLHLQMVDLLLDMESVDEAIQHLQRAQEALPGDGRLRAKAEELRRRMPILKKRAGTYVTQISPFETEVYDILDALYDGTVSLDEALERLRAFQRQAPDDLLIATELAHAVFQAHLFPEAVERYSQLLTLRPTDPEFRIDLAKSLAMNGDLDLAKECLTIALRDFPQTPDLHLAYVELLLLERDFPTARQNLHRALAEFPDHPHGLFLLGYLELRLGHLADSERVFLKLLAMTPTDEEVVTWYSRVMILVGRPESALKAWDAFTDTWRSLAEIIARVELTLAQGQTEPIMLLLRDVGEYRPRFVEDHLLFGKAFFYAGDFNSALREFDLVLKEDPDQAEALALVAMVYLLRNKAAKFWKFWQAAVERDVLYAGVVAVILRPMLKFGQIERLREETRKLLDLAVGGESERNLLAELMRRL